MQMEKLNSWLVVGANVGVLIGLLLLVYEIHQNSELMRAEIHSIRAEGKAMRQMDLANNGVMMSITAKAVEAGFPDDPNALDGLTTEERFRMEIMYVAIIEVTVNWHIQCEQGLLLDETCSDVQRQQILGIMPRARALGVHLGFTPPGFVDEVQRILLEEGLVPPGDDGRWPSQTDEVPTQM